MLTKWDMHDKMICECANDTRCVISEHTCPHKRSHNWYYGCMRDYCSAVDEKVKCVRR